MPADRAFNKAAFFRDLRYRPHAGQRIVHESAAPRRVLACRRALGQDGLRRHGGPRRRDGPRRALHGMDRGADLRPLRPRLPRDRAARRAAPAPPHHLDQGARPAPRAPQHGGGTARSARSPPTTRSSLLGEGLDFVIVDEAARMKPSIWEGHLSQRLLDRQGWALLISTPRGKGYFYDLFRRGQGPDQDFASWNSPSWTNPLLDRDVIERERSRLPERVFHQEYGAEFLRARARSSATSASARTASGRSRAGHEPLRRPRPRQGRGLHRARHPQPPARARLRRPLPPPRLVRS